MMPAHDMLVLMIFNTCNLGTRPIWGGRKPVMPVLLLRSNSARLYASLQDS